MTLSRFTRSTRACVQAWTSRIAVVAVITQESQRVTEARSIPNSARNKPRWETLGGHRGLRGTQRPTVPS
jgi:hypothetical protein